MKAMTKEIKEATIGEYIQADDVLNSPIKLRLTAVELKKEEVESNSGKLMDKIVFYFENNKGESKEIGVLSFDSLVRQMNALDPDIGDVLQLETFQIGNAKYLNWKVEIIKKATEAESKKVEQEAGEVEEKKVGETDGKLTKKEEEELLNGLPF